MLAPRHFRNVDETFNASSDFYECTVVSHNNNLTSYLVTNLEFFAESIPGVGSELLEAESDTLLSFIEVEDNNIELLIEFNDFLRIVYAAPREVCDVNETVNTAEVDEYTVRSDVLNSTFEHLTLLELRNDFLLLGFEFCFDKSLVRNNNVLEFLVDLNDLEFHCLTNEYIVVADGLNIDLRTGKERFDTEYVNNHTTLSAALDVTLNDFLRFESSVNAIPRLRSTSLIVRKNELTLYTFEAFNINFNCITYSEFGVVTEFRSVDDTIALVTDINYNFALVNSLNNAVNHFVFANATEGCFVGSCELFNALFTCYVTAFERFPIEISQGSYILKIFHLFVLF